MSGRARRWWIAAWVVGCLFVNPYVRGDGNGYYAWLVSPIIDGDLDFTNQFARADPLFHSLIFDDEGRVREQARTVTGRVGNQWSVGPAVLWAPWFLVAHLGVKAAGAAGMAVPADGYSPPYLWAVSMGTVTYGVLALWIAAQVATRLGAGRRLALAVVAMGLASSLPVYAVFLPFHVHALAAFSVAAAVAFWLKHPTLDTPAAWAGWGAWCGLMVQVYQLNGVWLVVPAWVWWSAARRRGWSDALRGGAAFASAGVFVCLPHLVGKAIVYGSALTSGYQDRFYWTEPRLWETLWSANHGWWSWTPVALLACLGLPGVWRSAPRGRPLVLALALLYVAVASYQNWHGQSSFGNRFLLSALVVLVPGLVVTLDWVALRVGARAPVVVIAGLVVWNAGFIFQWGTNIIPNRGPVDFRVVAVQQVTVVPSRLLGFVRRYLGDRGQVQEDIEREDIRERADHVVVR